MAKKLWVKLGESTASRVEVVHDGWIIHIINEGKVPKHFFLQRFDLKLENDQIELTQGMSIALVSESIANPGEEIVLKLTTDPEHVPTLKGTPLNLHYGNGVGRYWETYELTLT